LKSSASLRSTFNVSMVIVAMLSVGLVGSFWVVQEYLRFSAELIKQKDEYVAAKKTEMRAEVDRVIEYIDYKRASTEQQLKESIRSRVYEASAIANGIYTSHRGLKSDDDIQKMIKEALRPLIFNNGRGYFFMYDMRGNNLLLPFSPHLEGKNLWDLKDSKGGYTIQKTINMIREKGEGFQRWYWYKPHDDKQMYEKIGFSKHFEPYDWWIGTGEYIADFQQDVQKETLAWINKIRFGQDGYIFVYDFDGTILAHHMKETIGHNVLQDTTDPYGIKIVGDLIRLSQQEGGGFLEYFGLSRPSSGLQAKKIAHTQSVNDWQWTVGAGVYVDSINEVIEVERQDLIGKIKKNILISFVIFVFLLFVLGGILRFISKKTTDHIAVFARFFEQASTKLIKISDDAVHFSEFKSLARSANQMVDDRKRAEEALKRSANFTRALLNAVPTPVFYKDNEGLYQGCNRAFTDFMGVTSDEIRGKAVHELWPSDHAEVYHRKDLQLMNNPQHQVYAFKVKDKHGEIIPVIYAKDVFRDEEGEVAGLVGAFLDVSELKRTEEELRKANDIINRSPFVTFLWKNEEGWLVEYVSENVKELFGHTTEDFISGNVPFFETIHPEDLDRVVEEVMQHSDAENRTDFTHEPYRIVTKNGAVKWVADLTHIHRDSEGAISHYEGIVFDITDRKRAQEAQLEAHRMLQLVLDTIPVRVFWKDLNLRYLGCNQPFAEDAGMTSADELIGKDDYAMPWTPEGDSYRQDDLAVMETGTPRIMYEERQTTPQGRQVWLQTSKVPMRDSEDQIIGMLGTYQDITERKAAEEEVHRLRNYLTNVIDSMPSVLIGVDREGRVTQWNRQAELATGLSFESAYLQPLTAVFPHLSDKTERIRTAISSRQVYRDLKVPRKQQDNIFYEDVTIFPLVANGVEGAVIRVDDVTERVRLEELMIQSEKMLSIGGLAAGMAHEINNPLAGILQNAAVLENRLLGDLPANQRAAETAGVTLAAMKHYLELRKLPGMIDSIRSSGMRATAIVTNMLSFARKSDRVVSSHDLCTLLDQIIELAAADYDMKKHYDFKKIQIIREYDDADTQVPCEAGKIQQVFLNLLKNAAEAMSGVGVTGTQISPKITIRAKAKGDWVQIEIDDNGPGVDEKIRRNVFEPFFTTKPVGKGTGLGLSVSYFIVTEDHGGEMEMHPAKGGGACFVIRLPKSGKAVS
jgi:PAS domain S-box-containing protein